MQLICNVHVGLTDIMLSDHEEAIRAAQDAMKNLISACIDEDLIRKGVDQIRTTENVEPRRSGPTVVEKLCAIIESLLDYHYTAVFDLAFPVVSAMFDKLGILELLDLIEFPLHSSFEHVTKIIISFVWFVVHFSM